MTRKTLLWLTALPALLLALSVQAHEPSEPMEGDEKPNCSKMKDMDHSEMDMDDPVMQAMMEKCKHHMDENDDGSKEPQHKHSESEGDAKRKSTHDH
ncbi:hypothetical protein [Marinimicrobium sp. C2-29]|uniref:hypothetical protein n=1 Tax=Marinimicrobium sp. C2-29 TaxID=3139825 RepID=UPI003139960B